MALTLEHFGRDEVARRRAIDKPHRTEETKAVSYTHLTLPTSDLV